MAAAYSTGTASSPTNLLQALVTFLVAQGWTSDSSAAEGSGWRAHLHKGAQYVSLRASVNESVWAENIQAGHSLNLCAGTGYSGAAAWNAQAGQPVYNTGAGRIGVAVNLPAGSVVAHHLFDDGADNIVMVVERSAGIFGYLGFGPQFNKLGQTFTGTQYFFGSTGHYWANYTNADNPGYIETAPTPMSSGLNDASAATPFGSFYLLADVDTFTGLWLSGSDPNDGTASSTAGRSGYTGRAIFSPLLAQFLGVATWPVENGIPSMENHQGRCTSSLNSTAALFPVPIWVERDDGNFGLMGQIDSVYFSDAVGNGYAAGDVVSLAGSDYMLFPNFAVYKGA